MGSLCIDCDVNFTCIYLLEKGKSIGPAAEMVNWDLDENKIIDMNEV